MERFILIFFSLVAVSVANAQQESIFDSMDKCLERRSKFRYYENEICVEGVMKKTEAACFFINTSGQSKWNEHYDCINKDYYESGKPYRAVLSKARGLLITKKECEAVLEEGRKFDALEFNFCQAGIQAENKKRCYFINGFRSGEGIRAMQDNTKIVEVCIDGLTAEEQAKEDKRLAAEEAGLKRDCAKLKKMKGYQYKELHKALVMSGRCDKQ